eukprot:TRINITY_DN3962_c0_g1_i1.p1 TRINITY_DN3962_c0_g1~~TRINITY_DN3962_c0_g1_i1.p1  ORF type:complete len:269 (-),score=35.79 TRINITY_DN3962_c0_g1_i1:46-852(-)
MEDQILTDFINKYSSIPSKCRILDRDGSLEGILPYIDDPESILVAFDLDQTLKQVKNGIISVRGHEGSKLALEKIHSMKVPMIIITAQDPSIELVKNAREECRKLGISSYFDVEPWDPNVVLKYLESWGPNEGLSLEKLTLKLKILLTLYSHRYPKDLARISYTRTRFSEDGKKVFYRLHIEPGQNVGEWSAEQSIVEQPVPSPELCPVKTWKLYNQKTSLLREKSKAPDRMLLDWKSTSTEGGEIEYKALNGEEITVNVESVLRVFK